MALFGSGVAELTRHRAEQIARDLLERSKQNRDEMLKVIRGEIQNQIASLGVATKRDLERMERRIARLESNAKEAKKKTTSRATKSRPKSTTKKSTASTRGATDG
jgi:polyhydroxyalkanoate synthesis regulator phasin